MTLFYGYTHRPLSQRLSQLQLNGLWLYQSLDKMQEISRCYLHYLLVHIRCPVLSSVRCSPLCLNVAYGTPVTSLRRVCSMEQPPQSDIVPTSLHCTQYDNLRLYTITYHWGLQIKKKQLINFVLYNVQLKLMHTVVPEINTQ